MVAKTLSIAIDSVALWTRIVLALVVNLVLVSSDEFSGEETFATGFTHVEQFSNVFPLLVLPQVALVEEASLTNITFKVQVLGVLLGNVLLHAVVGVLSSTMGANLSSFDDQNPDPG